MDKLNYQIHTFGCKVNTYDTGLLQKNLDQNKSALMHNSSQSKIHVLNTCAVTAEATKEALKTIRRIKAKDPFATVIVTGCGAQVDTGAFSNLKAADLVIANSHKGMLPQILDQYFKGELREKTFKSNIFKKEDLEAGGGVEEEHTRAFVKIQDGCNSFCSYCIIPHARGKSRSIPIKNLCERINQLCSLDFKEVVLTGVHIGDYVDETKVNKNLLEDLLEEILLTTKIQRIRLTSFEPIEVTERLLDLFKDKRLCPHFHMSIQSANNVVLKDMKRNYLQSDVIKSLDRIYHQIPNVFIGMDVIVGFPTEKKDFFEDTYKALSESPWTRIHVFPYSERPGTRAAALNESIPMQERKERARLLRKLSLHRYQIEAQKQVGKSLEVLLLKKEAKGSHGLSGNFWPVYIENADQDWLSKNRNTEHKIQITKYLFQSQNQGDGVLSGVLS